MDAKEREELEAFARVEWPGVLVRVTINGETTIAKVAADRLEETEARWLALGPCIPFRSNSDSPPSSAPRTGAGTGRRKRVR